MKLGNVARGVRLSEEVPQLVHVLACAGTSLTAEQDSRRLAALRSRRIVSDKLMAKTCRRPHQRVTTSVRIDEDCASHQPLNQRISLNAEPEQASSL